MPQMPESKITIVLYQRPQLGKADQARLISQAVIKAYEQAQNLNSAHVLQWELNGWPKVCLKTKDAEELKAL